MTTDPATPPAPDQGLRRMLFWVFVVLVVTVVFAMVAVALTIRWLA